MDSAEAAELITELGEERAERKEEERFNRIAALLIAIMAALLAIGGLGGGNATDDMIMNNIRASDTWAFFQAKNMRQTAYELQIDALEGQIDQASAEERPALVSRLRKYRATVERYESEPHPDAPDDMLQGEGKRQLSAQAQAFETARDRAAEQDNNFDLAEVLLQLALVLGSVAILATNRAVLIASTLLGGLGAFLTLNGYLLLVPLPI